MLDFSVVVEQLSRLVKELSKVLIVRRVINLLLHQGSGLLAGLQPPELQDKRTPGDDARATRQEVSANDGLEH